MSPIPSGAGATTDDMARPPRINAPTKKKSVMLGVHVWEAIVELMRLTNEAYALMGGESKSSLSDQLELAVVERIEDFVEQFGPLPDSSDEVRRAAYVKKIADFTLAQLRKGKQLKTTNH